MRIGTVFVWTGIGAATAAVLAFVPMPARKASAKPTALPVVATVRATTVTVDGRLELSGVFVLPQDGAVTVGAAGSGTRMKPIVKVGDKVKKGQVLASVDLGAPLRRVAPSRVDGVAESKHAEQLSDALGAALSNYETALAEAKKRVALAEKDRDERTAEAKARLDQALAAGATDRAKDARAAAEAARQVSLKARERADKDNHAFEEGWISRNQATASAKVAEAAETVYREAQERADRLSKEPSPEEAAAAKAAYAKARREEDVKVESAKAELAAIESAGLGMAGPTSPPIVLPSEAALAGKIASRAVLRAPVDGTVAQTEGQIVLLKEGAGWEMVASVPAVEALRLSPGQAVSYAWGGVGSVGAIGATDLKAGTTKVRLVCPSRPPKGAPGKAVVTVPGRDRTILLPAEAVLYGPAGSAVFVVEDGTARRRPVTVKTGADGRLEVTTGIEAGNEVVVEGASFLKDGAKVVRSNDRA
ncbi:MAG: hypothetical protein JST30_15715 [Armatimonadetes bacterium]|nr:hypothetical protein [Armatimonadota bacterium]